MVPYVYKCYENDLTYEVEFPMGTAPESIDCGCGSPMRRVFLPAAISFKGSGFYKTDNPKLRHERTQLKVGGNNE